MSSSSEYTPPKVWTWSKPSGGHFANINRPIAGPTHEKELPVGRHPLQLYSLATPNGQKVTIMLEELLALGHKGAEYDAWLIRINEGQQFGSGFVAINPNSKIPALLDRSGPKPIRLFESGVILLYLAEKFGAFLPTEPPSARSASPGFSGKWARRPISAADLAISTPTRRSRSNTPSTASRWRRSACSTSSTGAWRRANMSPAPATRLRTWPSGPGTAVWRRAGQYGAAEFLSVQDYKNVLRWADAIADRPAVKRGRIVNKANGDLCESVA